MMLKAVFRQAVIEQVNKAERLLSIKEWQLAKTPKDNKIERLLGSMAARQ